MDFKALRELSFDASFKGVPHNSLPMTVGDVSKQNWNVLCEDLPFPVALIKEETLKANSLWMQSFVEYTGTKLCPHGKTTMSPQMFAVQLSDGAWGLTAATTKHLQVYRQFGVERIIFANQLLGKSNIQYVMDELKNNPDFDFYCLIDSKDNLEELLAYLSKDPIHRPLQLLLEMGVEGGRTGVRDIEEALLLAQLVKENEPLVCLRGVEAFEGLWNPQKAESQKPVLKLINNIKQAAIECDKNQYFGEGSILVTAGGSAFFDLVPRELSDIKLSQEVEIILRSGCYLSADKGMYSAAYENIKERNPKLTRDIPGKLESAIEVCSYVQALPEPGLAIVALGKRDISHDIEQPKPVWHYSRQNKVMTSLLDYSVKGLNDQHAFVVIPEDSNWRVGDLVGFGVSHPCTTFDKWQLLWGVDDNFDIVNAYRTFF